MTPQELERIRLYAEKLQASKGDLATLTRKERIDLSSLIVKHLKEPDRALHQEN